MTDSSSGDLDLGIPGVSNAVEIGSGGFGIVYRAIEEDLGRAVAVKVLTGNLDEGNRYRFERERRAMGRLSGHPNIVTVYRGGYTAAGNAYLVMEFLDRGSLADRLARVGPLGWEETLKFAVQLSGALETSHRAGVLHRDIKPGNILLSSLGNAKLCDFGIARLQGAPETKSTVVTASLSHAPPDIVNGARPDARSDVYSLASTMFELVAATPPFVRPTDESMVPILARIARDPVPTLAESQLPRPVFEVIEQAMAKEPDDRPATAAAFGQLLVAAQQRLGLAPTPIPIEAVAPEADGGASSHVPFPDTGSGPLPAPTARSPQDAPGATGAATSRPAADAPPTVVTSPESAAAAAAPVGNETGTPTGDANGPSTPTHGDTGAGAAAGATAVSGEHAAQQWAPPVVDASTSGPRAAEGGAGTPPTADVWDRAAPEERQPRPWLVPVAAVVAVAVLGLAAFALLRGDDDDDGDTASDDTAITVDPDAADGDDDDDDEGDGDGDEVTGTTVAGQGDDDYDWYETISDDTGSITIDVPVEWSDRLTALGTDDLPSLSAAPLLEGGFYDSYSGPGVQVAVARGSTNADFDAALDRLVDANCTSEGRTNVNFPYIGRVERFTNCGGNDTQLVHVIFVDGFNNLTGLLRVQMTSDRDIIAADAIRTSLKVEDNLPE